MTEPNQHAPTQVNPAAEPLARARTGAHHRLVSKEQAESWRYARRELEDALVVGDCSGMYDVVRARRRAVAVGLVLALLIAGGACLWAKMRPTPSLGDAVVVRTSDTDELLVLLQGVWHPAVDLASARVALGEPATARSVPSSVLAGAVRGNTVGLMGPVGIPAQPEEWSNQSMGDGSAGAGKPDAIGVVAGAADGGVETGDRRMSNRSALSQWWLCHDIGSQSLVVVPSEVVHQAIQTAPTVSGPIGAGGAAGGVEAGLAAGGAGAGLAAGGVGGGLESTGQSSTGGSGGSTELTRRGDYWVVRSESGTWLVGIGRAAGSTHATPRGEDSTGTPTPGAAGLAAVPQPSIPSDSAAAASTGTNAGMRRLQLAAPGASVPTGVARALGIENLTLPVVSDAVLRMIPRDGTLDDLAQSIWAEGGTSLIGVPIGSVVTARAGNDQSSPSGEVSGSSDYYLALAEGVAPLATVHARILVALRPGNLRTVNTAELLTAPREAGPSWSVVPPAVPNWPMAQATSEDSAPSSSAWMGCGRTLRPAASRDAATSGPGPDKADWTGEWLWIQGSDLVSGAVDTGIRGAGSNGESNEDGLGDDLDILSGDTAADPAADPSEKNPGKAGDSAESTDDMKAGFPVKYWGGGRARAGSVDGEFVVVGADGRVFDVPDVDVVKALGLGSVSPMDAAFMEVLPYAGEFSEKRVLAGPFAAQSS